MTRSEAIKVFFFKSVLPVTVALILYCIFKSACMKNGEIDYVWLWILCGLPFGLHRMCLLIVPGGGSLGGGVALFALNFIIGGVIGVFLMIAIVLVRFLMDDTVKTPEDVEKYLQLSTLAVIPLNEGEPDGKKKKKKARAVKTVNA